MEQVTVMQTAKKKSGGRRKRGLKKIRGPVLTTLPGSAVPANMDLQEPNAQKKITYAAATEKEAFDKFRRNRNLKQVQQVKATLRSIVPTPSFPGPIGNYDTYHQFLEQVFYSSAWRMVTFIARDESPRSFSLMALYTKKPVVKAPPIVEKQVSIYLHNWVGVPKDMRVMFRESKVFKRERDLSIRSGAPKTLKVVAHHAADGTIDNCYYGYIRNNRTVVNIDVVQLNATGKLVEVWIIDANQLVVNPMFRWGGNIGKHPELESGLAEAFTLMYPPLGKNQNNKFGLASAAQAKARKMQGW